MKITRRESIFGAIGAVLRGMLPGTATRAVNRRSSWSVLAPIPADALSNTVSFTSNTGVCGYSDPTSYGAIVVRNR